MEITTNIACRVKCDFCPQDLLIERYSEEIKSEDISYGKPALMTIDTFKKCLEKIPKSTIIDFAGYSEPFLNPDCAKMILYAHNEGYTVQVFTTLVGLELEDIEIIKNIPFKIFHIHLPDASMYAKIAVNKNYLNVLKKIIASNFSNLSGMCMGKLHQDISNILKTEIGPQTMISRAGTVDSVQQIPKKNGSLCCNRSTKLDLEDKVDDNVLLPNGDVAICCNDYGLKNIIGNLLQVDYELLFESENYKKFFNALKSNSEEIICRYCEEAIPENELKNRQILKTNIKRNEDKLSNNLIKLYETNLQRFPDINGFKFFYGKLISKEMSMTEIEQQIKKSSEYIANHPPKLELK